MCRCLVLLTSGVGASVVCYAMIPKSTKRAFEDVGEFMEGWKRVIMAATFMVPVQESTQWQVLSYTHIPSHKVQFSERGLNIEVKDSASPIIYPLKQPLKVTAVKVKGQLKGQLNLAADKSQGEQFNDDYVLRIGLVTKGDKTLNFLQRTVAADWVKSLYALAPEQAGIGQIYFLNVGQQEEHLYDQRKHPLSDLIHEKIQWTIKGSQEFELQAKLDKPMDTVALWIASDGDDTESEYEIRLSHIELDVAEDSKSARSLEAERETSATDMSNP